MLEDFRIQIVDGHFQIAIHLAELVDNLLVFDAVFVLDDIDELDHRAEVRRLDRTERVILVVRRQHPVKRRLVMQVLGHRDRQPLLVRAAATEVERIQEENDDRQRHGEQDGEYVEAEAARDAGRHAEEDEGDVFRIAHRAPEADNRERPDESESDGDVVADDDHNDRYGDTHDDDRLDERLRVAGAGMGPFIQISDAKRQDEAEEDGCGRLEHGKARGDVGELAYFVKESGHDKILPSLKFSCSNNSTLVQNFETLCLLHSRSDKMRASQNGTTSDTFTSRTTSPGSIK